MFDKCVLTFLLCADPMSGTERASALGVLTEGEGGEAGTNQMITNGAKLHLSEDRESGEFSQREETWESCKRK